VNTPEILRAAFGQAPIWTKWLARWKDYSRQQATRKEWPSASTIHADRWRESGFPLSIRGVPLRPPPRPTSYSERRARAGSLIPRWRPQAPHPVTARDSGRLTEKRPTIPKENNTMTPSSSSDRSNSRFPSRQPSLRPQQPPPAAVAAPVAFPGSHADHGLAHRTGFNWLIVAPDHQHRSERRDSASAVHPAS